MVQRARLSDTPGKRWTEASDAVEGIPRADGRQIIFSAAFDSTDGADESATSTRIDATGVVANPLLKRDALRRGRDPDARDNDDHKEKEEDIAWDVVFVRCSRVCPARRDQASER